MNKILFICTSLLVSQLAFADDTEIYGALAIDPDSRVNSNVLFIMDTSGSMDANVSAGTQYVNSTTYIGDYDKDYIFHSTSSGPNDGHLITAFRTSGGSSCTSIVNSVATYGGKWGRFKQDYGVGFQKWLQNGSDGEIICTNSGRGYSLYSANYMNWYYSPERQSKTRLETVVDVVNQLTYSLSDINLGLMRFDRNSSGGMIDVPVTDIATSGELIRNKLDSYYPKGGTPLSETLYEAARYYRSEDWDYGKYSDAAIKTNSGYQTISSPSVIDSRQASNTNKYKSPIESECQKNHVILLTDGEPSSDDESNSEIKTRVANMSLPSSLSKSCSGSGGCLDELAYWMKNTDNNATLTGNQDITLYTIGGFNLEEGVDLLTRSANFGGGRYYPADNTQGLVDALDAIFLDILATDSTFTAPAVSVNAFNTSEHSDELFYALFRPADNVKWSGNLKKYKLLEDGTIVGQDENVPAISESTGFFNESIFDEWNISTPNVPDGKNVELGGMANKMTSTPSSRNILSNNGSDSDLKSFTETGSGSVANETTFGVPKDDFTMVHEWSMGKDVLDENGDGDYSDSRKSIGDPLHSEPVIITYGGDEANPISSIFFGTNEGFIHSLDTVTGLERFSFIPTELHATQNTYFENTTAAGNKPYGMDGPITSLFYDKNSNGVLLTEKGAPELGEYAYIYAGMRRGGDSYYALDVTERDTPSLKFMIEGSTKTKMDADGKEVPDLSNPFIKLGQTWSKMTTAKVKFNGADRIVAFFGGGYDADQDGHSVRTQDDIGNAIYMVDASTGDPLWMASDTNANLLIPTMTNSIPASLSVVDITGDGFVDYLFAADTGGRVFRVDINQSNTGASTFAKGGDEIADLAEDNKIESNRRFYNKPNVSLVKDQENGDYLTISIGSGFRAHPISVKDVNNRFYVIKDFYPYNKPPSYESKSEAPEALGDDDDANKLALYDATALMKNGLDALDANLQKSMTGGGGWYVRMEGEGEKVLAESTTFAGAIIFTTFSPSSDGSNSNCGADTGQSKIYALNQKWAIAAIDLDGDGEAEASTTLAHSGIAPRPVVIYRKGGGKTIAIGTETIDDSRFTEQESADDCKAAGTCEKEVTMCEKENCYVKPVYWRQNEN